MLPFAIQMWTQPILGAGTSGSKTSENSVNPSVLPPAVNWHFWPWCNYGCKFCFARFEDIPRAESLTREIALTVPKMLADSGAEKITFVGGEPTLCPYLGELLIESKKAGLTTCIVTNASGLTEEFLDEYEQFLDWVGFSIDASNDEMHMAMGRGLRRDLAELRSNHLADACEAWHRCQSRGIRMKLNTVVCKENLDDDMTELVLQLRPERWKIFEVLPVDGQNDGDVEPLLLSDSEFDSWVSRHSFVEEHGIQFIPESNDLMRGSYAMMDSIGRFYTNIDGGHSYGSSVLDVGVKTAWLEVGFLEEKFYERGGLYDWSDNSSGISLINMIEEVDE